MAKMRLAINMNTLKTGAKVAGYVGAGAVAAKVGGRLADRLSGSIANFSAKSENNRALVDGGAGLLLSGLVLLVVAKAASPKKAAAAAPFVVGGVVLGAAGPLVADKITDGISNALSGLLPASSSAGTPGGLYFSERQGLAGEMPGGLFAEPRRGLAGVLPAPGGLFPTIYQGSFIGGELPR